MRRALVVLALVVAGSGCSTGDGDSVAPRAEGPTGTSRPTATAGPAAGGPGGAVPAGALVSAADLGPGWRAAPPTVTPCAPSTPRAAGRSTGLAEQRGTLTEAVSTHVDVPAAVAAWRRSLRACGYTTREASLGDADVAALSRDGLDAVAVTGTEGVLVVLHAHGELARASDELDSWADLALGTSCVAAPDGCH